MLQGGENGEAPPEQGGFMGGIMGKANALKAKAAETAAAAGAGNLQVSQPRFSIKLPLLRAFPRGRPFLSFRFQLCDLSSENHIWGCFRVKPLLGGSFNRAKRRCNRLVTPIFCFDKSTKDELTRKSHLHPLFCACASCASASTYVCAPMCTVSTFFYISQPPKCHMWSHLHTYVCMRLHMHMKIYLH